MVSISKYGYITETRKTLESLFNDLKTNVFKQECIDQSLINLRTWCIKICHWLWCLFDRLKKDKMINEANCSYSNNNNYYGFIETKDNDENLNELNLEIETIIHMNIKEDPER